MKPKFGRKNPASRHWCGCREPEHAIFGAIDHARGNPGKSRGAFAAGVGIVFSLRKWVCMLRPARLRLSALVQGDEGQALAQEARDFLEAQRLRAEKNWLSLLMPGFSP
jgi:hypothetical protein